jgi:hypothetical protein
MDYFGIHELITGFRRRDRALSKTFTTLFELKREDFLSIVKESPEDYVILITFKL